MCQIRITTKFSSSYFLVENTEFENLCISDHIIQLPLYITSYHFTLHKVNLTKINFNWINLNLTYFALMLTATRGTGALVSSI